MMNYKKLLKINFVYVLILALSFVSCSDETAEKKYVVKVGNSFLTESEIDLALKDKSGINKYREEYIQSWIETELLYQEANEEGVLENKLYQSIVNESNKKLAAAFLMEKLISENNFNPSDEELIDYYEKYKNDFLLNDEAFRLNIAEFNNFDKAVQFRGILIESDWSKAENAFRGDLALIKIERDILKSNHSMAPPEFYTAVNNLLENEISIVVEIGNSKYVVTQLIEKMEVNSIPPFDAVKDRVKDQYVILKQKEFVRSYIENLVDEHNIQIKRYEE